MREMSTYHGNPKIKADYVARVKNHRECDEIIQHHYYQDGKWDAIGATIHSGNHIEYEKQLGMPFVIARIQDRVHDALPDPEFKLFPETFLERIPVGVSLKMASYKFFAKLMYGTKFSLYTTQTNQSTQTDLKAVSDYLIVRMQRQTTEPERASLVLAEKNLKAMAPTNHAANSAYMIINYFKNKEQAWMIDKAIYSAQLAYMQNKQEQEAKFLHGKFMRDELLEIVSDQQFK